MQQPTPIVTSEDVDRILKRDFPPDEQELLRSLVEDLDVRETARVVLACLKVAGGDLSRARKALVDAAIDWRDVVVSAEYPNYARMMTRVDDLSPKDRQRVYEKDWQQYSTWLNAP